MNLCDYKVGDWVIFTNLSKNKGKIAKIYRIDKLSILVESFGPLLTNKEDYRKQVRVPKTFEHLIKPYKSNNLDLIELLYEKVK